MYCIDASVLTAVFDEKDKFHNASFEFIKSISQTDIKVIMPAFALAELAGALARKGNPPDDITEYIDLLISRKNFSFLALNIGLCELAADIAIQLKIKGSDSVYVAVSYRYNLKLITNDKQQMERGKEIIATATPEEESLIL